MARYLITTMPVTGHLSPLLPVAKALVKRGHKVWWYSSQRYQQRIERTGAMFIPFRNAQDIEYEKVNDLFPERAKLSGLAQAKWDMKRLIIDVSLDQYDDLDAIIAEDKPDVIIGDMFSLGAQFVAEKKRIPYGAVNVSNLGYSSRDTAPDGFGLPPSTTLPGRIRNRVLHWVISHIAIRDVNGYLNQKRAVKDLPPITETLFEIPFRAQIFLQPTVPAFEYPRSDLPDHIYFIGALIPEALSSFTTPDWWDELNDDRPVILITQGTVATNFDELINPAIAGLANEDALVIATTAKQPVDRVTVQPLPDNVRLLPFVPFNQLMPYVDVMVTNGGYGGTHFALTHGVPLVAAGASEDKAEICARIGWSGVGINLKTQTPQPAQIRNAVKEILSNPQYRNKAQAMQMEFTCYDAPAVAVDLLEGLVKTKQHVSMHMV